MCFGMPQMLPRVPLWPPRTLQCLSVGFLCHCLMILWFQDGIEVTGSHHPSVHIPSEPPDLLCSVTSSLLMAALCKEPLCSTGTLSILQAYLPSPHITVPLSTHAGCPQPCSSQLWVCPLSCFPGQVKGSGSLWEPRGSCTSAAEYLGSFPYLFPGGYVGSSSGENELSLQQKLSRNTEQ